MSPLPSAARWRAVLLARRKLWLAAQWLISAAFCAFAVRRTPGNDLRIYLAAAHAVRAGRGPVAGGYLYAPHLARLLALLPLGPGFVGAWSIVHGTALCALVAVATSCAAIAGTLAGALGSALLFAEPFRRAVALGNVEPLVCLGTVAPAWLLYRARAAEPPATSAVASTAAAVLAALLLGAAILLKIAPGLLALFVLRAALAGDRRSRSTLVALALLLGAALLVAGSVAYLRDALAADAVAHGRRLSDSNVSLVAYFGGLGLRLPSWVPALLALLFALPALRRMPAQPRVAWSQGICLTLLASPVTWDISYLRLVAPLGAIVGALLAGGRLLPARPRARLAEALLLATICAVTVHAGYFRSFDHAALRIATPLLPLAVPLALYTLVPRAARGVTATEPAATSPERR